ncbi:MAG: protein-methionine-sulfoxide reductase catalytic subunit MsrP [Rhodospirillales bacterium]|jgi:sulfoxide reductase catalytic subunit YedY|nr:protein-methionine-sulfoxide reductase catalytic subunit MsrP [Rhodospirillaceae bacterium]MDP6645807.1 protein-methionine-sulfoxide reductase catalytic subunit MsrP [Rhodospirillales bacterium]MDP6843518.1 protein-methionine-sulfoxide reductase catalytic subunit MsrP [Rhodospirillales bacterium]|tara:strand:+ start:273 stop:1241 length:969 start_codon:yes stop_codon:yes gene_type:complete
MLIRIKKPSDVKSSEITPKEAVLNRRAFMAAAAASGAALLPAIAGPALAGTRLENVKKTPWGEAEMPATLDAITSHNNFYEFGTGKTDPKANAHTLKPKPWAIEIAGHAEKTGSFDLDQIIRPHQLEERIYRMRCVEAWSMVIPWVGVPLGDVLKRFNPTSKAKFVAFETLVDVKQMPAQGSPGLPWPYVEGLRIDEAMHPLTLLAVGIHGEVMPNQNGAPVRLVVPWKYGFKGIKSIVKISFVEKQPLATWNIQAPGEYGFYSNVNPNRSHPRWSQAKERRITGEGGIKALFAPRAETLIHNGYAEEVASLYQGMDLMKYY